MNEVPLLLNCFQTHLFHYSDPMKKFMKKAIQQIPYLGPLFLNEQLFHKVLYQFRLRLINSGEIILEEKDVINTIIIVEHGVLEVFTEFEGNEFVIEKLTAGSVLNYRSIHLEDLMYVNVRAVGQVHLRLLKISKI